ncbi:MAG: peptidylprolyl isomerase [Gammaproteobacteria bacterium]|nr:peptidylprolyl isomerase [Gammaproteobacteria bacterium]
MVVFTTNFGEIKIEVFADEAPKTVANFLEYVNSGFYNGMIFHRVIPGFMIQGGGMLPGMEEKEGNAAIENEANNGLKNERGTLSMARTNDPHSASSQFFINSADNGFLDFKSETPSGWGYAVFAKVVEGMDVVDKISSVDTGSYGFHQDVPKEDIIIEKAEVVA